MEKCVLELLVHSRYHSERYCLVGISPLVVGQTINIQNLSPLSLGTGARSSLEYLLSQPETLLKVELGLRHRTVISMGCVSATSNSCSALTSSTMLLHSKFAKRRTS
jgi:hypothetical protein